MPRNYRTPTHPAYLWRPSPIQKMISPFIYTAPFIYSIPGIMVRENLLIIEDLLRVNEVEKREELDKMLLMVEKNRGKITIVNTNHPSGKQLESFGGIVVLLRYEIH